jgi:hypothetical protein
MRQAAQAAHHRLAGRRQPVRVSAARWRGGWRPPPRHARGGPSAEASSSAARSALRVPASAACQPGAGPAPAPGSRAWRPARSCRRGARHSAHAVGWRWPPAAPAAPRATGGGVELDRDAARQHHLDELAACWMRCTACVHRLRISAAGEAPSGKGLPGRQFGRASVAASAASTMRSRASRAGSAAASRSGRVSRHQARPPCCTYNCSGSIRPPGIRPCHRASGVSPSRKGSAPRAAGAGASAVVQQPGPQRGGIVACAGSSQRATPSPTQAAAWRDEGGRGVGRQRQQAFRRQRVDLGGGRMARRHRRVGHRGALAIVDADGGCTPRWATSSGRSSRARRSRCCRRCRWWPAAPPTRCS